MDMTRKTEMITIATYKSKKEQTRQLVLNLPLRIVETLTYDDRSVVCIRARGPWVIAREPHLRFSDVEANKGGCFE